MFSFFYLHRYGEQETKVTVRVEHYTHVDMIAPTFLMTENTFITENDALSLSGGGRSGGLPPSLETSSYLQLPPLGVRPLTTTTTNGLYPTTNNIRPTALQVPTALDDTLMNHKPSTYTRLKSVGRFVGRNLKTRGGGGEWEDTESVDGQLSVEDGLEEEGEDSSGPREFENPYLQNVCYKIGQYFRGKKDVEIISADRDEVTYKLPKKEFPLSEIFGFMELLKKDRDLHIVGYSVSQSTLEQVCVNQCSL